MKRQRKNYNSAVKNAGKIDTNLTGGDKLQPKTWNVHTKLESKNAERWEFLTALPSGCCIMKLKPM